MYTVIEPFLLLFTGPSYRNFPHLPFPFYRYALPTVTCAPSVSAHANFVSSYAHLPFSLCKIAESFVLS